ncbi:UTP--glucose-1-phosphate uridylyltransferase GalU [Candidatus Nitrosacidococcus tergens]|uniref:UTP--glucose-1-phosphate uridylyltransferase n=1 Tax=Candidatus Nitrosacidococcus tergens TaxID=553981 RepID=A0A7G1Q802_9GAMM|nr:UTP--glucose-1-phosphate uridylyltransferase GalU [Candidatus Nitrosacidococcus tergens]CAB1274873.1 UTP--glucose-1-phosphate uridylyltransferase [Candidatus Nitrosacidococcus tergens]
MKQTIITKAIFPVAGLGTRFLPATKASPKEMLPVVDKPLIQYAVEEAIEAGITSIIFITGRNKQSIANHFDKAYELETELEHRNKRELLTLVRNIIPSHVTCVYIRQEEALGLGHAVLCAAPVINDEPFAVILADDLIDTEKDKCLTQMVKLYDKYQTSLIGVEEVPLDHTDQYGIIHSSFSEGRVHKIDAIIEKPKPEQAPSSLAVVGRYILTPRVLQLLRVTSFDSRGEIQLTDAIATVLNEENAFAYQFNGKRYDCGSKLGYLQATVEHALKHADLGKDFKDYLHNLSCFGENNENFGK